MPQQGIPPRLAYRLLDPNSGAVVVPDLYHLHQSKWTIRALIGGYPGSAMIGDFSIALPPPYTEEFARNRAQYDAILNASNKGIGLKVEGYNVNVNAGPPVVSGVITKMDLPLDTPWTLSGSDTMFWLQQSQVLPSEPLWNGFAAPTAQNQFSQFLCTQEGLWDDDFNNWSGVSSPGHPASTDYTASFWAPVLGGDILWGLPALGCSVNGGTVITNTTWTTTQWAGNGLGNAASVTASGVMRFGTSTTQAGALGLFLLSDTAGQNGWHVAVAGTQTGVGTNLWNISVFIYSESSGTFTVQASALNVIQNWALAGNFPFELTAVIGWGQIKVILNGIDANCVWNTSSPLATGAVGMRFTFNAGGGPTAQVNHLQFHSRTHGWGTDRFQQGTVAGPGLGIYTTLGQGQTHLDMLTEASTIDGVQIRKRPGAGRKADILDYLPTSSLTDYSSSVIFDEAINVVASGTTFQNVAEVFATDVRVNAVPAGDVGGTIGWGRIATPGDMVLTDTVSDVGHSGYISYVQYVRAIQARVSNPLTAVQVAVVRTPELLRANNGWGPRDTDLIQVNMPTYGIHRQTAMIVGYQIDETTIVVTYFLTQFPASAFSNHPVQRIQRSVEFIGSTYQRR